MDKLEEIFKKQEELQSRFLDVEEIPYNQEYININILACLDELSEVLRETQWKNPKYIKYGWKKTQEFNLLNYKKELIDLLHFYINLCLSAGIDANELFDMYIQKNKENHGRQNNDY